MALVLVVEDGSALADANTFTEVSYLRRWAEARGLALPDADTACAPLLVDAADYLRHEGRFPFKGVRRTYAQALPFPRVGCTELYGAEVPPDLVPWRLVEAQCALACDRYANGPLQAPQGRESRIQTETVGPITTSYFADAPREVEHPVAVGLLAPLLRTVGGEPAMPLAGLDGISVLSEYRL